MQFDLAHNNESFLKKDADQSSKARSGSINSSQSSSDSEEEDSLDSRKRKFNYTQDRNNISQIPLNDKSGLLSSSKPESKLGIFKRLNSFNKTMQQTAQHTPMILTLS